MMTLVGWPEWGASVFILPDIWASALVCLFKLAQQGPEVASDFFFLGQILTVILPTSFSVPPTCSPSPDSRSIRISSRQGWQTGRSEGHVPECTAGQAWSSHCS